MATFRVVYADDTEDTFEAETYSIDTMSNLLEFQATDEDDEEQTVASVAGHEWRSVSSDEGDYDENEEADDEDLLDEGTE